MAYLQNFVRLLSYCFMQSSKQVKNYFNLENLEILLCLKIQRRANLLFTQP